MSTRTSRRTVRRAGQRRTWYDSGWRIAGRAVSTALAVVVVALVAALLVVPRVMGGSSLTVLTGSMEPTFTPGDVIVVRGIDSADVCSDVGVGDIVTYMPTPNDPTLITHRVVGMTVGTFEDGTRCRLVMQGDANSAVDEPVSPDQVRGLFLYGVPKLGLFRQWAGDHVSTLLVVGAVVLIGYGVWSALRAPRTRVTAFAEPGRVPSGPSSEGTIPNPPDSYPDDLRARELALSERELTLRERELAFARWQAGLSAEPRHSAISDPLPVSVPPSAETSRET